MFRFDMSPSSPNLFGELLYALEYFPFSSLLIEEIYFRLDAT
jgi:hypothetical protein